MCCSKKRGVPRTSNGGLSYGNSANNTTDDVSDMFAGMTYCQAAASATVVEKSTEEVWLGDSGATSHITNYSYAMKNKKSCDVKVTVSTGEMTTAKFMGDIDMLSGNGEKFRLENVLYIPSVQKNLFSTCRFYKQGRYDVRR